MLTVEVFTLLLLFIAVTYAAYTFSTPFVCIKRSLLDLGERRAKEQLKTASLDLRPTQFFLLRLCLAGGMFVLGLMLINWGLALLLCWFGYAIPGVWLRRVKERRLKRLTEQLVDGLELMGNGLKSGLTLAQAIELLVSELPPPLSEEFQQVLAEVRLGLDIEQALKNMAARLELAVVTILATGVSVTQRCGGDLTQIFENIAETIRARAEIEGKIQAVSSLGRFQGMILSIMPFALLLVLYFIDREHVESLFEYKFGLLALGVVVSLVIAANFWMSRLLKIDA